MTHKKTAREYYEKIIDKLLIVLCISLSFNIIIISTIFLGVIGK